MACGDDMKRSAHQCMVIVITELLKGPTTIGALCRALGVSTTRSDKVQVYLKPLRDAGVVRISGWVTQQQPIMAMQSAPFALPDEPMPAKRQPQRKTSRRLSPDACKHLAEVRKQRRKPVSLGPNSVFNLGVL